MIEEFGAPKPEQAVNNLGRSLPMHRYDPLIVPATPPRNLRYKHRFSLWRSLRELTQTGELIWSLTMRSFISSYKQEKLGLGWAVIQPFISMIVMTIVFKKGFHVQTGGVPYPLFSYLALLPWGFFSNNCDAGVGALIGNMTLLNKVHCPREVFPISSVVATGITTLIQTAMLLVFFVYYGFAPKSTSYYAIPLVAMLIVLSIGASITLSVLVVYLRDLRRIEPLFTQFGLFLTPVGYTLDKFPKSYWAPMSLFNPMVPIIDGIRRCVLDGLAPQWNLVGLGLISTCLYFFGGYILFKKIEPGIADVA